MNSQTSSLFDVQRLCEVLMRLLFYQAGIRTGTRRATALHDS